MVERLSSFLLSNDFVKGKVDTTLFIKHVDSDILIVQIYVDDIIFGSTNELLCKEFEQCMQREFEMSLMSELNYFLDSKSSKCVMGFSYVKPSIPRNSSRSLGLKTQKFVTLPWPPPQA